MGTSNEIVTSLSDRMASMPPGSGDVPMGRTGVKGALGFRAVAVVESPGVAAGAGAGAAAGAAVGAATGSTLRSFLRAPVLSRIALALSAVAASPVARTIAPAEPRSMRRFRFSRAAIRDAFRQWRHTVVPTPRSCVQIWGAWCGVCDTIHLLTR